MERVLHMSITIKRLFFILIISLIASVAFAALPPTRTQDEGGAKSVTFITNYVGDAVTRTVSGTTATVTVSGGGAWTSTDDGAYLDGDATMTGNMSIDGALSVNESFYVNGDGNVIIGSDVPEGKLTVVDGNISLMEDDGGQPAVQMFADNDAGEIKIKKNGSTQIHLDGEGDSFFDAAGANVGIGTENPSTKLNVIGDISGSGHLTASTGLWVKGDNVYHGTSRTMNGMSETRQDLYLVVDSGEIYCDVEKIGGGDMEYLFNEQAHYLDCTTGAGVGGRARVQLEQGTATVPKINYIYVTDAGTTALLEASTTVPTGSFAWVAIATVQDDTTFGTNGALSFQRCTESFKHNGSDTSGDVRGAISYMREKLRWLGARYVDGCAQTLDAPTDLTISGGTVFQLHRQTFPSLDVSSDGIYVANTDGTGSLSMYEKVTSLADLIEEADGDSINNGRYYGLTVWATMASSESGDNQSKLFVNLPTGSYNTAAKAAADVSNRAVRTVPSEFNNTAFLVCYLTLQNVGGTPTVAGDGVYSLLGSPIGTKGGGASLAEINEFSDAQLTIFNDTDVTKLMDFDLSNITGGNERTLIAPDHDYDFDHAEIDTALSVGGTNLVVTEGGNVGIGTDSPVEKLQVTNLTGDSFSILDSGNNFDSGFSMFEDIVGIGQTRGFSLFYAGSESANDFKIDSFNSSATPSTRLVIGRAPTSYIVAKSDMLIHTSSDSVGSTGGYLFKNDANSTHTSRIKGGLLFERQASYGRGDLHLAIENTADTAVVDTTDSKLVVRADGNVGIGDTTPDALLEVSASAGASNLLALSSDDGNDGDLFMVLNNGNVGIGDTTPDAELQVDGEIWFGVSGDTDKIGILETTSGNVTSIRSWQTTSPLALQRAGGNVGIGTTTPNAKLAVAGDLTISEALTMSAGKIFWLSPQCGFREGGTGDLEYTENSGGTWADAF